MLLALLRHRDQIQVARAKPLRWPGATVTVVIPNYNYARYLTEAVHSALSQPGVSVDAIIVDDASTANSVEVARDLAADDERMRVLVHRTNAGPQAQSKDGFAARPGKSLVT